MGARIQVGYHQVQKKYFQIRKNIIFSLLPKGVQEDMDTAMYVLIKVGLGATIYISNFADMFMLTTALCAYKTVSRYATFVENLPRWSLSDKMLVQRDFSCLVTTAKKIEQFFKQLNAVASGVCLAWFLMVISRISLLISVSGALFKDTKCMFSGLSKSR